jgi:hypothetical protein
MTYQQAVSMALDFAQRRQRPAYVIELAEGWGVSSAQPRRSRGIPVEAPALDPEESGPEIEREWAELALS